MGRNLGFSAAGAAEGRKDSCGWDVRALYCSEECSTVRER
jgi:hypothetical protein